MVNKIMQQEEINIFLATDKNYFDKLVVAITSILYNHKSIEKLIFHILTSDLTDKELKIAKNIKSDCEYDINFVKIKEGDFNKYVQNQKMQHLSISTFYRFLIPDIAQENMHKAIYLDCDLVVCSDISELYYQDIGDNIAGAVEDKFAKHQIKNLSLKTDKYFNAGVLLLNLDEIRKNNFQELAFEYYNQNKEILYFHDQDILNALWDSRVKFLDERFNAQSYCFLGKKRRYKKAGVKPIKNPVVIHYTGAIKPWQIHCLHKKASEWMKYQQMTPYKLEPDEMLKFKIKKFLAKIIYIKRDKNYGNKYFVRILGMKL